MLLPRASCRADDAACAHVRRSQAMLWEIDIDNSKSIGFDEFVKFLTYAFIDTRGLGGWGNVARCGAVAG